LIVDPIEIPDVDREIFVADEVGEGLEQLFADLSGLSDLQLRQLTFVLAREALLIDRGDGEVPLERRERVDGRCDRKVFLLL
jgi:hypothetical protein